MATSFTWLGHSAFSLDIDGHPVLIDPFLTGNPLAAATADQVNAEIIFLSHAHGDHLGDTVDIAKRTGAKVVSNFEISEWMQKQGVNNHGQNPGGGFDHGFVHARWTVAHHSSSFPDGTYGGESNGFVLTPAGSTRRLYFAGDTALFSDMQLIGESGIEVAFLPIGDNYTMGPEDAVRAVNFIRPRYVVPMHYNTFDAIAVDVAGWAQRVSNETESTPIILDPGGAYSLD